MATPIKKSPFGFRLERIEPSHDPAWQLAGPRGQRLFWNEAARVGLEVKHSSIIRGLGRDGVKVANISAYTRRHRRSAMTASGKGSPSANPLTPGYTLSRAYQYLRAIVEDDGVYFGWRFDPKTRRNWGEIMSFQAKRGRDMIGFSADDWDAIVTRMDAWWAKNRARLALMGAAARGFRPIVAPRPVVPKPLVAARPLTNPHRPMPVVAAVAPPKLVPKPLAGLTIAAADARRVRTAAEAGTFSGFRRPKQVEPGTYAADFQARMLATLRSLARTPLRKAR